MKIIFFILNFISNDKKKKTKIKKKKTFISKVLESLLQSLDQNSAIKSFFIINFKLCSYSPTCITTNIREGGGL